MKKVIKNSVYDTETATRLGYYDNGFPSDDHEYFEEALYRTKSGKYFLYGKGGWASPYSTHRGLNVVGSEKIEPLTYDEATEWAQERLDGDEYVNLFGDPEDDTVTQTAFYLSASARNALEKIRAQTGETLSAIVEQLIIENSKNGGK